MKCLQEMRAEMERRKASAVKKNQVQAEKKAAQRNVVPPKPTIGRVLEKTPVLAAQEVRDGTPPPATLKPMNAAQKEALVKGGRNVLAEPIPEGYHAVSKNQRDVAEALIRQIWETMVISFDFETDADQEEGVDILRDKIVGVSFACVAGTAYYFPVAHDAYAANWQIEDVIEMFRPCWESTEILKIAFNIKFEFQILLRYGVRMPYENVADPMIMVQMTAQFEELALKKVTSEILPYLFDKYAEKVLPEILSAEELDEIMIEDGDEKKWINDPEAKQGTNVISLAEYKERKQKKAFWDAYVVPFKEVTRRMMQDGVYKSGKNKGQPKWKKVNVSFNEMPVDKKTVDYGCKDSDFALQVYLVLKPILDKEGLMPVHDLLDAPFMMVLGEVELNGWRVNPQKLQTMYEEADSILAEDVFDEQGQLIRKAVYRELDEQLLAVAEASDQIIDMNDEGQIMVPAGKWYMNKWKGKEVHLEIKSAKPFNWGSPQHLQWLFYVVLGIPWKKLGIKKSKASGLPSTGADEIDKMIFANPDIPFFRTLLRKREYEKIRDTYALGILDKVQKETNRVHATLKLVRTWRLSCSGPNLQNIPRLDNDEVGIRYCFEARPGFNLVSCDYSQIELRFVAFYANDDNMKDAYRKNQDLHSRVAKEVWKLDCTVDEVKSKYKVHRYKAKSVNLAA